MKESIKTDWKRLLLCLAIPLGVGGLAALLTGGSMADYSNMNQPPLAPPGWLFPVVWTVLYLMMGYASYRVVTSGGERTQIRKALMLYGAQLAINFLWPVVFFGLHMYLAAFFVLLLLWLLVALTIGAFARLDDTAADLLLPYILWVTYAAYLNVGAYLLN